MNNKNPQLYNNAYLTKAIKWAIRNEMRRRYKWYVMKNQESSEQEKIKAQNEVAQSVQSTHRNEHSAKNKLTYKEKLELQALSEEIEKMELEKTNIERIFNGETTLPPGSSFDLVSQRYSAIKDMLDEKELRWLELSDKES